VTDAVVTPGLLRGWPLPRPDADDDKHDRGQVLVVGGSVTVPGGAMLAGIAALRAGAGKLQIVTTGPTAPAMAVAIPEALVEGVDTTAGGGIGPGCAAALLERAEQAAAVVIGPGMVDNDAVTALVRSVVEGLRADGPLLVLDASAVSTLDPSSTLLHHLDGRVVLTPNASELGHLIDDDGGLSGDDRQETAARVAERLGAVVADRGHIVAPDGSSWRHEGGTVGLATSGSGDVLAGLVTGLAARGASAAQAAVWGVHAHGRAGERLVARIGGVGFLARELLDEIPAALAELSS
jgi:hydroxyethylthiazole kinase-like uncharacterized protein yjeF